MKTANTAIRRLVKNEQGTKIVCEPKYIFNVYMKIKLSKAYVENVELSVYCE